MYVALACLSTQILDLSIIKNQSLLWEHAFHLHSLLWNLLQNINILLRNLLARNINILLWNLLRKNINILLWNLPRNIHTAYSEAYSTFENVNSAPSKTSASCSPGKRKRDNLLYYTFKNKCTIFDDLEDHDNSEDNWTWQFLACDCTWQFKEPLWICIS